MPMTPGLRIGPYEIVATLGAGGMGEVYRARDTSLDRDVARETSTRFTFDSPTDAAPIWSPTGTTIAFRGTVQGVPKTMVKDAVGGAVRMVNDNASPTSWSPDGRFLLVEAPNRLRLIGVASDATGSRVGSRNGNSQDGTISPDGGYLGFESDESGRQEVYVQQMPPGTAQWKVSANGGTEPRWRGDGRELFFVSPDLQMMAVDVQLRDPVVAGVPRARFRLDAEPGLFNWSYDVTRDGQRFLMSTRDPEDVPITVVRNWWVEVERKGAR